MRVEVRHLIPSPWETTSELVSVLHQVFQALHRRIFAVNYTA